MLVDNILLIKPLKNRNQKLEMFPVSACGAIIICALWKQVARSGIHPVTSLNH